MSFISVSKKNEEKKVYRHGTGLQVREWMARKAHNLSDFLWLLYLWLHQKQTWHSGCLWHRSGDNISPYLLSLCSSLGIVSWYNSQHLQMYLVHCIQESRCSDELLLFSLERDLFCLETARWKWLQSTCGCRCCWTAEGFHAFCSVVMQKVNIKS